MSKNITGAEYSLDKIFSSDFEFVIPPYQRPYAWTTEQAGELFDDLYNFYQENSGDDYFLGSIVLIKEDDKPKSDIIDGQQRITTLTILFAVLSDVVSDDDLKKELRECVVEPGKKSVGREAKPRLTLRERDKKFFSDYVQQFRFSELLQKDEAQLSTEAQINIKRNSQLFHDKLSDIAKNNLDKLEGFITFLLTRCFLVTVSTTNQKSAFRVFSVMNNRGLDLQPTDIFKAEIIGDSSNNEDTEKWEDLEAMLGRSQFNDLFAYIRMIYAKDKARKALIYDFPEQVLSKVNKQDFIKQELEPYAEQLRIVNNQTYQAVSHAESVNYSLSWLNRIGNSDWKPVAIRFLKLNAQHPEYVDYFFKKLERLAAMMLLCGENINDRISRYAKILTELDKPKDSLDNPLSSIELEEDEQSRFINVIQGDVYQMASQRRNYLILRLDSFIAGREASYKSDVLTIEHVLPQTVHSNSEWAMWWHDEKLLNDWIHKLANLLPLNKRRNSAAQNYDFAVKKEKYFMGTENVSTYALTTQVLNKDMWAPKDVEKRQEALIKVLKDNWQLK